MSSLARWFNANGYEVVGYDKAKTPLTEAQTSEGIYVFYDDEVSEIELELIEARKDWLVVYTPAIPKDSIIKNTLLNKGVELYKRSQVLGFITESTLRKQATLH